MFERSPVRAGVHAWPRLLLALALLLVASARPASAQGRVERVHYRNPSDGTPLTATLHLPPDAGPVPVMVVLSLAGVDGLVHRMEDLGWAVMVPQRRGMGGTPELLLRARFRDLADDVLAAEAYLRTRREIDGSRVALLAQGGETLAGMLAAVDPPLPTFVVLISPRGIAGDRVFRTQQRVAAERRGLDPEEVEELDRQVDRLSRIVRGPGPPSLRAYRLRALFDAASVRPQQSSSFPADLEGQVHAFSSPWWHDYFTVAPDSVLTRIRAPTLVLEGSDPFVAFQRNLPPIRRSLEAAPTDDVTLCVVEGRVEHAFPPGALDALEEWVGVRTASPDGPGFAGRPGVGPPRACVEDAERH